MFVVAVGHLNMNGAAFGVALTLSVAALVLGAAAWVGGLMVAARLQRWDWLVGMLLLGPLGALLFCLILQRVPAVS